MKRTYLVFLVLLTTSSFGADPELFLKSAPMPFYPPLCRQARISGSVKLRFTVDEQGDTSDVEAVTGHPMLKEAAVQNVRGWKFLPHPRTGRAKEEAVFVYEFSGKLESPARPNVTVRWFGKTGVIRVEVEGDLIMHSD